MINLYSLRYNDFLWLNDNDFNCIFAENNYQIPIENSIMIFHGGSDIDPHYYGEKVHPETWNGNPLCGRSIARDQFESDALDYCIKNKIPMIGVCRGAQWLCIKAGGILNQHVPSHRCNNHDVTTTKGTFSTKGDHHQTMILDNTNHKLIGYCPEDGIPEIAYFYDIKGLAIQFHPEWMMHNHIFNTDILPKLINDYLRNSHA